MTVRGAGGETPDSGATRFRIGGPGVLHETVEEQTIIVNLDTGTYYDLNHTGAFMLSLIEAGASQEQIADALARQYEIDATTAGDAVGVLVQRLLDEELIVSDDAPANGNGEVHLEALQVGARPYAEPVLGKYTDMQELLLLDPVHEVDESGWPRRA